MPGFHRLMTAAGVTLAAIGAGACTSPFYNATCSGQLITSSAGPISEPALTEISGIDAGSRNPDVWWVHNDSGHPNVVRALDATGAVRGTFTVSGATNLDWEDLTVAPGAPSGTGVLFVGDIGDNASARSEIQVYRFPEPAVALDGPPTTGTISEVETMRFTYPDGAHDAETLLYDALTGDLIVITKNLNGGTVGLYRGAASGPAGTPTALTKVRDITLPAGLGNAVTGGDIAPDGKTVVLRTYGSVRIYTRPPAWPAAKAFDSKACTAPLPSEGQGEAVGFSATGTKIVTVSEGAGQNLNISALP